MYNLGWEVFYRRGHPPETVPVSDFREHELGTSCWCRPHLDVEVLVHNAMDQREGYEIGRRLH